MATFVLFVQCVKAQLYIHRQQYGSIVELVEEIVRAVINWSKILRLCMMSRKVIDG